MAASIMNVGRYTIRLSDPSEFASLQFGETVNLAEESKATCKDVIDVDSSEPVAAATPRRRSTRQAATPSSSTKMTRSRKRQAALRLSETSPVFDEKERICQDGKNVLENVLQTTNALVRFALVEAIQPNDILESIYSLGAIKTYKCSDARVNVQAILAKRENYPVNLVFCRMPEENHVDLTPSASPRKRTRRTKKPAVKESPTVVDLVNSDEEDDTQVATSIEMAKAPPVVVVSVDSSDASTDSAIVARPDPTPGYEKDEWVLTPFGPGVIDEYRIDRFADNLDTIVNPILSYQVTLLDCGTLYCPAKQLQPFDGSPYANEIVVAPLTRGDVVRLQPGVYLNDALVNFFLSNALPATNKVHVFSSFFYTKLANLCQGAKKQNTPEFRLLLWDNLKNWIKSVNLWDYDLLLIPVHDHLHWSLIAICHPGLLLQSSSEKERIPFLLHLDSGKRFRLHQSSTLFSRIRAFLAVCLEKQHQVQLDLKEELLGGSPPVPAQANETDCGMYMLEWIERLLSQELVVTKEFAEAKGNVAPFGKTAFTQSEIDRKRHDFQSLIYTLSRGQSN